MKRIAALVPLLLVLTGGASPGRRGVAPRDGEVRAVSVVPAAGSVEVVIDLRGAVDIQDFTLANPARLVVDLQGARLVAPAVLYDGANRGGIKNIRYAQFRPGVVRVVIDLDALKDYQVERREGQVRVKIGSERTAFEAWSSQSAAGTAAAPLVSPAAPVAQRPAARSGGGGQAARVATPVQTGDAVIDAYFAAHANESAQSQAARITVAWGNADLREVVAGLAAFSGRTIILSKDVKGNVSAEIKNQPWDLAFNAVLESQALAASVLDGGIIQVIDKRDLARADSTVPVETRLVRVNYARAAAMVPSVQSILTQRGKVVADSTSNALVITEISSRINRVEEFVKGLDIRTPQVSIQAKIIFVDRTDVEELGVKYDLGSQTQFLNKLVQRPDPRTAKAVDTNGDGVPDAFVPQDNFAPNQTIVDLGGNSLSAIGNADQEVVSQVLMEVHAERSNVKPASVDIGFTFQTQQADNQILVNDGETAVIGGLTVTEVTVTKSGIPFLVDLPILGKLFGFSSEQESRRDLLILITPHIIDDLVTPSTGK